MTAMRIVFVARAVARVAAALSLAAGSLVLDVDAAVADGFWYGIGPPANREDAAYCYDSSRRQMLIYGGQLHATGDQRAYVGIAMKLQRGDLRQYNPDHISRRDVAGGLEYVWSDEFE